MATLSPEQLSFLRDQGIPLSQLFDASGMRKADYPDAMREGGQNFAFGTAPCAKGNHTLRTRAGHCIQCDTSKIAYQLRHQLAGHVYLAGSASTKLLKVGTTIDLSDREQKLCEYAYGGATDWEVLASAFCKAAGKIEAAAHRRLAPFSVPGQYERMGRQQACYELFRCGFADAKSAFISSLPPGVAIKVSGEARANHLWPT